MRETRDHRVVSGQVRRSVRLQNRPSVVEDVGPLARLGTIAIRTILA